MKKLMVIVIVFALSGCASAPVQGSFQQVCDGLVAMGPATRSIHMGANAAYYDRTFGIHYDSLTDEVYTRRGDGTRDVILKGSLIRAQLLIDDKKKPAKSTDASN